MASQESLQASSDRQLPLYQKNRPRINSQTSTSRIETIDREQLAQTLDKIHSTASHSETLTTFNEFASPPSSASNTECKSIAGDLMQNGFSGLYSRFRGAVGAVKERTGSILNTVDQESLESLSYKDQKHKMPISNGSVVPQRDDYDNLLTISAASSRIHSPTSSHASQFLENQSQVLRSSKTSLGSTTTSTPVTVNSKSFGRLSITSMTKASTSAAIIPTVAPINVNAFKDEDVFRAKQENPNVESAITADQNTRNPTVINLNEKMLKKRYLNDLSTNEIVNANEQGLVVPRINRAVDTQSQSGDKIIKTKSRSSGTVSVKPSALNSLRATEAICGSSSGASSTSRKTTTINHNLQSYLPGYKVLRTSADYGVGELSPKYNSANNSIYCGSLSLDERPQLAYLGNIRTSGTASSEGAPEVVNVKLERMRKQVLSKEFWMADDICKECFLCGDAFSAFRRKHHCRTCGCIFDSKCTSIVSGQRFGVQGSLRVCTTCLEIINRRHDSSGSEDSSDDSNLPIIFHPQQSKYESIVQATTPEGLHFPTQENDPSDDYNKLRPLATPMMAIPATRRINDSTNRRSAVLEIDVPQLNRPSSSKSLKSLSVGGRPPSSGHKRHHSKHNMISRFRNTAHERPPFHRGIIDDLGKRSKLPTFHDDNIIDPDLAPYMSDEGSSADEQMSIFATVNQNNVTSPIFDCDRSGFGSLLSTGKRHRARTGDKSISGYSFTTRNPDDFSGNASIGGFSRQGRRRNLSATSINLHYAHTSPRHQIAGFSNIYEKTAGKESSSTLRNSRMIRSASMRDEKAPAIELNSASLHHVRKLLFQLLEDANIPNLASWEKALIPILLQCTDDVNPNVKAGDDINICHYVKLKKIPGGKPGATAYVSGVVFTKNLALKSMSRSISNPRIVIVSFPIEYQRYQHHFMSLEPVIAQEKEFLRNMVNRIASLRPQLLLVQKHVSGLALQYLTEANIAVAYNVKQSVIEAVSRCAQTEIISSIDMVALKPVRIGKSAGFDLKTYVHDDIPRKKKTYVYLSGCSRELGCTIVLRGGNMATLTKMKRITEFMVYVVYNLKLETCLMRDEFVLIPSIADNSGGVTISDHQQSLALGADYLQKFSASNEPISESNQGKSKYSNVSVNTNVGSLQSTNQSNNTSTGISALNSKRESNSNNPDEEQLPEDIPMPTFYSDMVAKYQTKILSASPFVKFVQPYLLMRAREQERRLIYFKRLKDQDIYEEQTDIDKSKPQKFQLIKPEMVHNPVKQAPRQIMEALHAVHDAEYDKALHNYQTQKRQWENYLQGSLNLFEPYAHQNITVLYTVVCTSTFIPCAGPELLTLVFYNEHVKFDSDCTLGQYVEDICLSATVTCASNGCELKMSEHHRTYVHGEARITVFVEKSPCKFDGLQDSILMWSYCKICRKETPVMPMSENTWKYSLGKYLELSFWSSKLHLRAGICPHDIHRDHLRYFGYRNMAIRIHYDPIDLLEIVVPRARITWKVDHDLRLKNDMFLKFEEKWNRFMASVHSRIKGINIDGVASEKVEACKTEVERLAKLAQEEHSALIRKLQQKYMDSKYYEIIPLNRAVRAMQEKVAKWDDAFADFDANFFPSEKDIRRLAVLQLKGMFMDREDSAPSAVSLELSEVNLALEEKSLNMISNANRNQSSLSAEESRDLISFGVEEPQDDSHLAASNEIKNYEVTPTCLSASSNGVENKAANIEIEASLKGKNKFGEKILSDLTSIDNSSNYDLIGPRSNQRYLSGSSSESVLSENAEKSPKSHPIAKNVSGFSEISGIPRPAERLLSRRSNSITSPPTGRINSQPTGAIRRLNFKGKSTNKKCENIHTLNAKTPPIEPPRNPVMEQVKQNEKRNIDQLALGTIKAQRKAGHSMIPRSIHNKLRNSKVSNLAEHFEQLSREFEKERLRDRKQRAAKGTQSRAFPKASSKPIVEVYKDIQEAVEQRDSIDDELCVAHFDSLDLKSTKIICDEKISENLPASDEKCTLSPTRTLTTTDEPMIDARDNQQLTSQAESEDEVTMSDVDQSSLVDIAPSTTDIAETLRARKKNNDLSLEFPKHEKNSLMKLLSNFWAERSASGWTPLKYPMSACDHIFADVDIIVREDEPSSLIAFALQTQDYKDKLAEIRRQGQADIKTNESSSPDLLESQNISDDGLNQAGVETSLLRATGTHLAYSFVDGTARMQCKIFFAEQFDAVRRKCGVSERIVESLSRCLKWDSKGGKTKSVFLKTLDDRLVLKSLSPIETAAFLKFAPAYFNLMAEALFHDLPTVIAKLLGFYQIIIKNPATGSEIKWDVLLMENLFYDRSPTRIFDLKGSMRNRKIQSTGEQNEVLLDENMVEYIYESPLFAREHSKKLLRAAIFNDTLFLQRNDVMDYSLMIAVDEVRKELVVGIIDVVRTYTWDKKLESWIKDRGFAGGGRNRPTVTSPKEYKSRFREAMNRYILQAPNCWHQCPQFEEKYPAKMNQQAGDITSEKNHRDMVFNK
ncbi:putative 1-phosphatidylinositol-3-phosphate 5-kinase fab1 [Golovinomyces cichoracearum]|uniref:1-phosphatidylinositol-3-phosphate 5-kinase n=1 Tax=Golovinomyces cichoracearum TaxID=62708 RepID=A0A420IE62_9PEZI|nr:putative 1-phosphatidylinositol-3-phosphate 5-kinase fab1 [Golovinomyces cichoracearum]